MAELWKECVWPARPGAEHEYVPELVGSGLGTKGEEPSVQCWDLWSRAEASLGDQSDVKESSPNLKGGGALLSEERTPSLHPPDDRTSEHGLVEANAAAA